MDILLQNKMTMRYVAGANGWTAEREDARVFSNGLEAVLFCLQHPVANMQIVGRFADPRMNFAVSVTDVKGD